MLFVNKDRYEKVDTKRMMWYNIIEYLMREMSMQFCRNQVQKNHEKRGKIMKRKLIATLLVLGLMLSFVPMTIFSTSAESSELRIANADQLVEFATNLKNGTKYAGVTVYIENDVDLTGKTWPLDGCYTSVFSGMIDGQGHTIKNVTWTTSTYSYQGLFGAKIQSTTADFVVGVKNLTVKDVTVKGQSNNGSSGAYGEACIGGLFGKLDASTAGTELFDNLDLTITVDASKGTRIGGMIGESRATNMTISNCIFRGSVTGKSEVGGLIGWQIDRKLTTANTVVSGSVTASGANCGGFYGQVRDMDSATGAVSTITGCVFDGTVTTSTANAFAGGFVGLVGAKSGTNARPGKLTIENSAFYGTVYSTLSSGTSHAGGLVGATNGGCNSTVTLDRCIIAGKLDAPTDATVGNYIRMTIAVVASTGTVTATNIVGNTSGQLTSASGTWISQDPGGSGTKKMNGPFLNGGLGQLNDGNPEAKFYYVTKDENEKQVLGDLGLDLSDTFVPTTSTKPLPMGVVRFYADKMDGVSDGAATYAYGYQTNADGTALRMIGLLKATDGGAAAYENVGLEIVAIRANGTAVKSVNNANKASTDTVYTAIMDGEVPRMAYELDKNYNFIFTVAIEGIQANGGMITFVVRSFHEKVDGVRTYDDTRVINYDPAVEAVA